MRSQLINLVFVSVVSISSLIVSGDIPSVGNKAVAQTKKPTIDTKPCARQELPKLKQNMPYSKAREMLLEAGWQAIFNREILNSERSAPVDYFFTKKEYTEIQDCAGSGLGLCYFRFESAYGEILYVTTANNGANQETIFGWRIEEQEEQ
ncbi:hypothetical protein [Dolichospermum circinale]|uniref:hypothetical protein n=1 Tax=Dolichospermum circinale TaxID=109265 RepID=UPI00232CFFA3|nr:hypothetical protein [Dolichospermum circinale]MDB9452677.1 hypothetical protein [Dolichospermum circinale CS-547]